MVIDFAPDHVYVHDRGVSSGLSHILWLKQQGISITFIYHSPGHSCPQRALLRNGRLPCDGELNLSRCTRCQYLDRGLPASVSSILAQLPILPYSADYYKGVFKLLQRKALTQQYIATFQAWVNAVDQIQIHADWVKELLLRNGVPSEKIVFRPQPRPKLLTAALRSDKQAKFPYVDELQLVFLGRCNYIKGIHLLVEAVQSLPGHLPIKVHFLGPYWGEKAYGKSLLQKVAGDDRFTTPRLVPYDQVKEEIACYDLCVIPSLWPETGPLVMYDAWAAGVPVIGADLGGMREHIQEGVNGYMFRWNDAKDLARVIFNYYQQKRALDIDYSKPYAL